MSVSITRCYGSNFKSNEKTKLSQFQMVFAIYFTSEGNSSNITIQVLKRLIWVLVCWDDVYAALKPHGVNDGRTTGMGVLCHRKTINV
jgi:hypothetical protein